MCNATKRSKNSASAAQAFNRSPIQRPYRDRLLASILLSQQFVRPKTASSDLSEDLTNMLSHARLDRHEFLSLSALTSAAALLPQSLYASQSSETDLVSLEVTGDAQRGYGVTILYRGQAIARHHQGGELSAVFQNSERSLEDRVDDWKATSWKRDGRQVGLFGEMHLANLRATVSVEVRYEVVSTQVTKKTIQLRQADMFALLYQITNRLEPATTIAKLW